MLIYFYIHTLCEPQELLKREFSMRLQRNFTKLLGGVVEGGWSIKVTNSIFNKLQVENNSKDIEKQINVSFNKVSFSR